MVFTKFLQVKYFTKKDHQCEDNNFLAQFASNGPNLEGTNTSKGIINFSIAKVTFCNNYKKILTDSSNGDRLLINSETLAQKR